MVVETNCDNCNTTIKRHKYQLQNSTNTFCSTECHNKFQRHDLEKVCPICGDTFTTKQYDENTYCGRDCYAESKKTKITVSCDYCGDQTKYHKYLVEKQDTYYCSKDCRSSALSESWSGENNPNYSDGKYNQFGENWQEVKESILKRSNGFCESCGKSEKLNGRRLDVHHIIPRSYFIESDNLTVEDSNVEDNLVALCQTCHAMEEPVTKMVAESIL